MWSLDEQALYENIDLESRQVDGFNIDVLSNLIKFYLLKPTLREKDVDNSENLGEKKYIHNLKVRETLENMPNLYPEILIFLLDNCIDKMPNF